MMLIALQDDALIPPATCYRGFSAVVSTVDRRYGAMIVGSAGSSCGRRSVLFVRDGGSRWSVVKEASVWYCNDRYAPRAVIEDLFRSCMPRGSR